MPLTREQLINLLHLPLPELSPPVFAAEHLYGLRSLTLLCRHIKLIYGLRALQPLAEHGPAAIVAALTLVTEILSAFGAFLSSNPETSLRDLRAAAVSILLDLRPGHEPVPDADLEPFRSPQVVLLEAAEMAQLRRARSAGTSEEIVRGAALMVNEIWELAAELGRSPAGRACELINVRCWGSPATTKVLRVLGLDGLLELHPQRDIARMREEEPVAV
ncbi:MAG: hypothetical protein GY835_04815 [bacterium]|nr:hypothetical protein [bacterium]